MTSRGFYILKAIACAVMAIICIALKFKNPEQNWSIAGALVLGLATVGFAKRAIDKY